MKQNKEFRTIEADKISQVLCHNFLFTEDVFQKLRLYYDEAEEEEEKKELNTVMEKHFFIISNENPKMQ